MSLVSAVLKFLKLNGNWFDNLYFHSSLGLEITLPGVTWYHPLSIAFGGRVKLVLLLLILLLCPLAVKHEIQEPKATAQDLKGQRSSDQIQTAIENAAQEVANQPESAQAHFHFAQALAEGPHGLDTPQKIAREYLAAIKIKPDYAEAYYGLARIYYTMAEYHKVYESLNKAIELKPNYAEAYLLLSAVHMDEKKLVNGRKIPVTEDDAKQAIDAIEKAVKIKPDYGYAYNEVGIAYLHLNKVKEAVEAFKQALLYYPNGVEARYALCKVYIDLGDKEAAMQEYRLLIETVENIAKKLKDAGQDSGLADSIRSHAEGLLKKIQQRFGNT